MQLSHREKLVNSWAYHDLTFARGLLYDKIHREDVLWEAWQQVKANQGAPGVDGKSIEAIVSAQQEAEMIQSLQQKLRTKTYHFQPVRRVDIPKPKGGVRPLGIATVEDRVSKSAEKF